MSYQPRVRTAIMDHARPFTCLRLRQYRFGCPQQVKNLTATPMIRPRRAQQQRQWLRLLHPLHPLECHVRPTNKSDQGKQYGQPGFVGEPINLNVVNADIRDILNYITEQYGVNFVIDSSVGAVPVTVNVSGRALEYCAGCGVEGEQVGN